MGIYTKDCGFIPPLVHGCEIMPPMYNGVCVSPPQVGVDSPSYNDGLVGCPGQTGMYVLPEPDCSIWLGRVAGGCGASGGARLLHRRVGRKQKLPMDCFDSSKSWQEKIATNPYCSCVKEVLEKGGIPVNSALKNFCKCIDPDPTYSLHGDCWMDVKQCESYCGECKVRPPNHPVDHLIESRSSGKEIPGIIAKTKSGYKCMPCSLSCGDCRLVIPDGNTTHDGFSYAWKGKELQGVPDMKECVCRRCESYCGECIITMSVSAGGKYSCYPNLGVSYGNTSRQLNGIWDPKLRICKLCEPNPFKTCGAITIKVKMPVAVQDPLNPALDDPCKAQDVKMRVPSQKEELKEVPVNIRFTSNSTFVGCDIQKGRDGISHVCGECEAEIIVKTSKVKVPGIWAKKEEKIICRPCASSGMAAKYVKDGKLVDAVIMTALQSK